MKKTLKVAAAALTMAAGLATTSASAVQIDWGNITGFSNGDTNVTFDFSGIGLGSVNLLVMPITNAIVAPLPTVVRPTNSAVPQIDSENHAGFTSVTGDVLSIDTNTGFRHQLDLVFDFSNYLGLPGSLVLDLGSFAGNDSDGNGSDINILTTANLLSDINGTAVLGAQTPGQDVTIDVIGAGKNDGDFLFGGFAQDTSLNLELILAKNDGINIGLGAIPVPAPASALLLIAGLAFGRRKFAKRAA